MAGQNAQWAFLFLFNYREKNKQFLSGGVEVRVVGVEVGIRVGEETFLQVSNKF